MFLSSASSNQTPKLPLLSIGHGAPWNGSVAELALYNVCRAFCIDFLFVVSTPLLGLLLLIQAARSVLGVWLGSGCRRFFPTNLRVWAAIRLRVSGKL